MAANWDAQQQVHLRMQSEMQAMHGAHTVALSSQLRELRRASSDAGEFDAAVGERVAQKLLELCGPRAYYSAEDAAVARSLVLQDDSHGLIEWAKRNGHAAVVDEAQRDMDERARSMQAKWWEEARVRQVEALADSHKRKWCDALRLMHAKAQGPTEHAAYVDATRCKVSVELVHCFGPKPYFSPSDVHLVATRVELPGLEDWARGAGKSAVVDHAAAVLAIQVDQLNAHFAAQGQTVTTQQQAPLQPPPQHQPFAHPQSLSQAQPVAALPANGALPSNNALPTNETNGVESATLPNTNAAEPATEVAPAAPTPTSVLPSPAPASLAPTSPASTSPAPTPSVPASPAPSAATAPAAAAAVAASPAPGAPAVATPPPEAEAPPALPTAAKSAVNQTERSAVSAADAAPGPP